MKPFENSAIFDAHYLPLVVAKPNDMPFSQELAGGVDYYRRNNREVKLFSLPYQLDDLFFAIAIYEMHSRGGTHFRRKNADFFSLEFIREGQMYVRQNSRCYLLEPGDVFLMLPGERSEYLVGSKDYCIKSSIALSGLLLADYLKKSGLRDRDVLENVDCVRLSELFCGFKALANRVGAAAVRENSILTYQLLRFLRNPAPCVVTATPIERAIEYMENYYQQPLSCRKLAEVCGCSASCLARLFREVHNISPHQMLIRLRMKHASQLLLNEPALLVKEVAARVGYVRALNFSAEFRRRYGLSPSRYREYYGLTCPHSEKRITDRSPEILPRGDTI